MEKNGTAGCEEKCRIIQARHFSLNSMARGCILKTIFRVLVGMIFTCGTGFALGSKLSPTATAEERKLNGLTGSWISSLAKTATTWGVVTFGDPVHEEITNRIFGCDGTICDGLDNGRAPAGVLSGVRWNDDPPFKIASGEGQNTSCKVTQTIRFITQPRCWLQLFRSAEKRAAAGVEFDASTRAALLYRTHFGDLQYLHAMASKNGIPAGMTRKSILEWAEFNWRIIIGDYGLETKLAEVNIDAIQDAFGKTEWTVQELYTLGSPGLRPHIQDVAFGSILHQLQDSFAEGHVDRAMPLPSRSCAMTGAEVAAPGLIAEFHAYNAQDHDRHAQADARAAFEAHLQDDPDVVELGRVLVRAFRAKRSWFEVRPYLECIYELHKSARVSSPGEQFSKT